MISCAAARLCIMTVLAIPGHSLAQESPFVRDLLTLHNEQRARHGLEPFVYNDKLAKAAQDQAEWMARNRKPITGKPEEHLREQPTTPDDFKTCNWYPVNRVINAGYFAWDDMFAEETRQGGIVFHPRPGTTNMVQENIAKAFNAGHPAQQTTELIKGWMKSPGHRKNILTAHLEEIGIGTACIDADTYWCVVFATRKR